MREERCLEGVRIPGRVWSEFRAPRGDRAPHSRYGTHARCRGRVCAGATRAKNATPPCPILQDGLVIQAVSLPQRPALPKPHGAGRAVSGVVLVAFIGRIGEEGESLETAVYRETLLRPRPVLMTAAVASLGLLP